MVKNIPIFLPWVYVLKFIVAPCVQATAHRSKKAWDEFGLESLYAVNRLEKKEVKSGKEAQ